MSNPFSKFVTKTKKVKIKSLGAEVEVREPTVNEASDFYKIMSDEDGKINTSNFFNAKIIRVSSCMVNPVMSESELRALPTTAASAINEIYEAIDLLIVGTEGNEA